MPRHRFIGMPKAKKKKVEQPEQPEAEEDEGSIEEEDAGSELEPEEEPSPGAPAVPRLVQHRLALLARVRATALIERDMCIPFLHHMLHAREARARAYAPTAARLIAFSCAVDRLCIPRTSQVTTPRGFGASASSRRLATPTL